MEKIERLPSLDWMTNNIVESLSGSTVHDNGAYHDGFKAAMWGVRRELKSFYLQSETFLKGLRVIHWEAYESYTPITVGSNETIEAWVDDWEALNKARAPKGMKLFGGVAFENDACFDVEDEMKARTTVGGDYCLVIVVAAKSASDVDRALGRTPKQLAAKKRKEEAKARKEALESLRLSMTGVVNLLDENQVMDIWKEVVVQETMDG